MIKLTNLLKEVLNEAISDSAKVKALEKFKKENPDLTDKDINPYIEMFSQKQESYIFKQKDIFQYKFSDLKKIIDDNFPKTAYTKTDKDEVDFKGSEDVVYNQNGLLILKGDLKEKCIRYGKGYKWCISKDDASNLFFYYRMRFEEPAFYFVFDEDKPEDDPYHAIVIVKNIESGYYVVTAKNDEEVEMTWYEVEAIQPKLKGLRGLFRHAPLTREERKDYDKYKKTASESEYSDFTYEEKEKYIGFVHRLTERQIRNTPKALISKYATTTTGDNIPGDILKTLPPSDVRKMIDNIQQHGSSMPKDQFESISDELKKYYMGKVGSKR